MPDAEKRAYVKAAKQAEFEATNQAARKALTPRSVGLILQPSTTNQYSSCLYFKIMEKLFTLKNKPRE